MNAPSAELVREEIARELGRVQEGAYGETECNIDVALHDTFVAVVMELHLSVAEEALIDNGNATTVAVGRDSLQLALASTSSAIVERATGRRVTDFSSHAVVDEGPAWATDVFRLGETRRAATSSAEGRRAKRRL
jgi:uncharacterized protein YbcI